MGMDLYTVKKVEDNYYRFNIWGWSDVMKLMLEYGWQPEGTVIDDDGNWIGTYDSNDGQVVTDKDAKGMKEALERAVEMDNFTEDGWKEHIKGFIKFLENGAFSIW